MNDHDLVGMSVRQFTAAWRLMCATSVGYTATSADGIDYVFSGAPIAFFNVAILNGRGISSDALQAYGTDACRFAASKQVPWLLIVTTESLAPGIDAVACLDGCALGPMMPMTGMLADRLTPAARAPENLRLTVPDDDRGCAAILDVNSLAYGMDLDAGKPMIGRPSFWQGHFPVIGIAGDTPVCSAAVMMVEGYRYVALVATDPEHQRRGYGDAAMRHALAAAAQAQGERQTVLHATDAGRPVYERMGYRTISTHTVFMEKRFLHGN
jgi:ribosomal protein S18 acetylase RimI-like enzyme